VSKLTPAAMAVLKLRSDRNKIGVPADRSLISAEQQRGLQECLDGNLLTWIDRLAHPSADWRVIDVYLLTPAGRTALGPSDE
jgi:hypothetical protein